MAKKLSPLELARAYLKRGWTPIAVSRQTKRPIGREWQLRWKRGEDAILEHFADGKAVNIGLQMGPASGNLTDYDLDCPQAIVVGRMLMPPCRHVYGRESKPESHYLFETGLANIFKKANHTFRDTDGSVLLEVRIGGGDKGAQSVAPGSVHESGEEICWDEDAQPDAPLALIQGWEDWHVAVRVAVATLLARHWPDVGGRHDAALTVGSFLSRAHCNASEVRRIVEAITAAADDREGEDRAKAAEDAVENHMTGGSSRGYPAMVETFGEAVAHRVADWLNYGKRDKEGVPEPFERPLSDYREASITWLWPYLVPRGTVAIFEGEGEVGKSRVARYLAAQVSSGQPLPEGGQTGPMNVLICSFSEDPVEQVTLPQIRTMGGNLDRVFIVERPFTLDDTTQFEEAIKRRKAKLVILDPLADYIPGKTNSYKDEEVRRFVMGPLSVLARKYECTIICIRHFRKSLEGDVKYRGAGSMGFTNVSRASVAFIADPDAPDDAQTFVLGPNKGNWAPRSKRRSWRFAIEETDDAIGALRWLGESEKSVEELHREWQRRRAGGEETDAAKAWLAEQLASGAALGAAGAQASRHLLADGPARESGAWLGHPRRRPRQVGPMGAQGAGDR